MPKRSHDTAFGEEGRTNFLPQYPDFRNLVLDKWLLDKCKIVGDNQLQLIYGQGLDDQTFHLLLRSDLYLKFHADKSRLFITFLDDEEPCVSSDGITLKDVLTVLTRDSTLSRTREINSVAQFIQDISGILNLSSDSIRVIPTQDRSVRVELEIDHLFTTETVVKKLNENVLKKFNFSADDDTVRLTLTF